MLRFNDCLFRLEDIGTTDDLGLGAQRPVDGMAPHAAAHDHGPEANLSSEAKLEGSSATPASPRPVLERKSDYNPYLPFPEARSELQCNPC